MNHRRSFLAILAICITSTAMAMTAAAAIDRGGTTIDQALLVALSLVICAGTNFIPAISKHPLAWLIWGGCLLATIFGHVTFFTHAEMRAGDVRVQSSHLVQGAEHQIKAVNDALASIKSRPTAVIAADLAVTEDNRLRHALRIELGEAKRAEVLHDELLRLSATVTTASVMNATDPVTTLLMTVIRSNPASISLGISLGFSILLELLGAFLWFQALQRPDGVTTPVASKSQTNNQLTDIREAIASGKCLPTVAGIRKYLSCGQSNAMKLHRELNNPLQEN